MPRPAKAQIKADHAALGTVAMAKRYNVHRSTIHRWCNYAGICPSKSHNRKLELTKLIINKRKKKKTVPAIAAELGMTADAVQKHLCRYARDLIQKKPETGHASAALPGSILVQVTLPMGQQIQRS